MEELDFKELFTYYKSKLLFICILTFVIFILGSGYSIFLKKPRYTSSSTIVLASENSENSSITQNDILLNQKLVDTYREIVKSRSVLERVITDLKLDQNYEELANQISVTSIANTEIIKISVIDEDKKMARKIANTVTKTFSEEVINIYNMKNVNILDKANMPMKASNQNILKECIIYLVIGIFISSIIVFVMYYFDTTLKNVEQIESKLGLPILGTIPLYKGGK